MQLSQHGNDVELHVRTPGTYLGIGLVNPTDILYAG